VGCMFAEPVGLELRMIDCDLALQAERLGAWQMSTFVEN
jgi:hypothetical protein